MWGICIAARGGALHSLILQISTDLCWPNCSLALTGAYITKGVALQYILYSDLRPRSRRKSKVKVGFLVGQKSSIDFLVYTTIDTFRDSCVNVILQKFTRDWTKVKHNFSKSQRSRLDRGRRLEYSKHWVPPPCIFLVSIIIVTVIQLGSYMWSCRGGCRQTYVECHPLKTYLAGLITPVSRVGRPLGKRLPTWDYQALLCNQWQRFSLYPCCCSFSCS